MRYTRTLLAALAALLAIGAAAAGIGALSLTAPAAHAASSAPHAAKDATQAFWADLTDGQPTDFTPEQADYLLDIAHYICQAGNDRDAWLLALTDPGPHALSADEAGKLYDTALGAFCPNRWGT